MRKYFEGPVELTPLASEEEPPCASAEAFSAFCQEILAWAAEKKGKDEEEARLNVAYIRLQHRYFEYKERLSERHANERGARKHPCVSDVYDATYRRLRNQELARTGLPTSIAPRQPRSKRYQPDERPKSIAELLLEG